MAFDSLRPCVASGEEGQAVDNKKWLRARRRTNENGAAARPRRRAGGSPEQALNELPLPDAAWFGLNSLARPFSTSVPAIMSCRPCLRWVHATIRKPTPRMMALRNLAK